MITVNIGKHLIEVTLTYAKLAVFSSKFLIFCINKQREMVSISKCKIRLQAKDRLASISDGQVPCVVPGLGVQSADPH